MAKKKQNRADSNKCKKDMMNVNKNMKNSCNENEKPSTENENEESLGE